jgi:hypothetical protein
LAPGVIEGDKYPHAPRLDPLRAALAKFEAAREPTPLPKAPAAGIAALYPRIAWSLDMMRAARRPATASEKLPLPTQMSARCFAQVSCSSRLFMCGARLGMDTEPTTDDGVLEREFNQERERRGNGVRTAIADALLPSADRAQRNLKGSGEFGLSEAELGARGFEFIRSHLLSMFVFCLATMA